MTNEELQYCQNDVEKTLEAFDYFTEWKEKYQQLVIENENLVYYTIKKLGIYKHIDEFYDLGMVALVRAAQTFDEKSGYSFSNYAINCIKHELYSYGRKQRNNRWHNMISLDNVVNDDKTTVLELIADDVNIEEYIIRKELYKELYKNIKKLSTVEQLVINCSYGLNGYTKMSQHDIKILLKRNYKMRCNSQAYVSRIKGRAIKKLKKYLKDYKEI